MVRKDRYSSAGSVLQIMLRKNIFLYMYFLISLLPLYISATTNLKEGPGGAVSLHLSVVGLSRTLGEEIV